jgi:hypothetical protein
MEESVGSRGIRIGRSATSRLAKYLVGILWMMEGIGMAGTAMFENARQSMKPGPYSFPR